MTDTPNDRLLDRALGYSVLTERWKNHEALRILRILDREVLPDLKARLAARLANIATRGFDTGPATTARLRFLYRDIRAIFDDLSERLRTETEDQLASFAETQAAQIARDLKREVGTRVSVVTPSAGAIRSAVFTRPLVGRTLRERWDRRADSMRGAVEEQVRIGLIQGETPEAIISRVRAVWPAERRRVAQTVRAAVAHAQTQARESVFEENASFVRVRIVATLDLSTCVYCGELDGQVFDVGVGPRPPFHLGPCRCQPVPEVAYGGTRASQDGQVSARTRWSSWVERQSPERQDKVFGRGIARLYRAGRVDVADLVDAAGRPLSLERVSELVGS